MARYEGRHRTAQTEPTQKRGPADRPAPTTDSAPATRPAAWGAGPSAGNLERAAATRRDIGRHEHQAERHAHVAGRHEHQAQHRADHHAAEHHAADHRAERRGERPAEHRESQAARSEHRGEQQDHRQPHDHHGGRHREPAAQREPARLREAAVRPVPQGPGVPVSPPTPQTRRAMRPPKKRNVARPVLAGTLALGLGASGFAYAKANNLIGADTAAFVVGSGVVAQTDELARAATVDTTYRAAASVSRNERRTAIAATGLRSAKELEAKKKVEAARKAAEAREAQRRAELERERKRAIANARNDPKSAARVLMLDYGWSSDAQYNCLVNLWTGESGWRWNAENASSGAYGIPQSLPASKMGQFGSDYRTNPITQIKWGLWYIQQSYGNPCNAWSTWQARSPHWY